VLRWSFRGTHAGEFWTPLGTVPVTEKTLTLSATITYRVKGGRIAEEWACIDWLDVVHQLGVIRNTAGG
jgi:predicted ester cyclase